MSSASRPLKDAVYEQLARIGKAVASPLRLEILDLLAQAPRTVEAIGEETGQSTANASQHLQVLRRARLVEARKDGLYVTYSLAGDEVRAFVLSLRRVAEARLAEVGRITREFYEERGVLEPVDRDALVKRVRRGEVTVLDVRPTAEYEAGHIPGARSIPIDELRKKLATLPKSREIVAYCRGPYCVYSAEAVKILRARGFKAVRFDEGVSEWKDRGLAVEEGS
jgi:rhodanese-related sulfurtransferase/DNA-binding transcriptional ArsR family regulator